MNALSLALITAACALAACSSGETGDAPIAVCVPGGDVSASPAAAAGSCDEAMFEGGISAKLGDAERGEHLFKLNCSKCHGETGKGIAEARRVDMTSPAWQASLRDGTIVKTLRAGRPPTMPAFTFADQELKDLLAHVRKLEVAPAAPAKTGGY